VTDADQKLAAIADVVPGLIQALTERLTRHGLGEIEVRRGELRVRVVAAAGSGAPDGPAGRASASSHATGSHGAPAGRSDHHPHPSSPDPGGVTSPAVGYFSYADGLGPGLAVEKGDALGYVDVLGVRHDVRAPRSGVVRNLVTEAGEAVEYGQVLIELEAAAS
jgi:acetyl-CoA carboxylase biotin carboxyl carrier protein